MSFLVAMVVESIWKSIILSNKHSEISIIVLNDNLIHEKCNSVNAAMVKDFYDSLNVSLYMKSISFWIVQHSFAGLNLLRDTKFFRIMLGHSYHKVKLLIASPKELDNASQSVILNVLIWMTGNQWSNQVVWIFILAQSLSLQIWKRRMSFKIQKEENLLLKLLCLLLQF